MSDHTRPTFIVIGAAKCATTSLCALLGSHPQVFMSEPKEPWYFSHYYQPGMVGYEKCFVASQGKLAIGEGSTSYTKRALHPRTAERMAKELPNVKLIYITRHPLRQIESHWLQMRKCSERDVDHDFSVALRNSRSLIDTAKYFHQISAYRDHYPDTQILTLFYEDYARDQAAVLRRCFEFIGVDPQLPIDPVVGEQNVSEGALMDTAVVSQLRRFRSFYKIRDLMPGVVVDFAKRMLKKPITGRPQWTADSLSWATDQLREDARAYLKYCGRAEDFWTW